MFKAPGRSLKNSERNTANVTTSKGEFNEAKMNNTSARKPLITLPKIPKESKI